jgi:hypothetical protein
MITSLMAALVDVLMDSQGLASSTLLKQKFQPWSLFSMPSMHVVPDKS